ncbi:MAG TPA: hypothetical protein VEY07_02815 [Thermoplasmata archaeon]|nr:hypothetical protein [Thermoplasmata archaeon]
MNDAIAASGLPVSSRSPGKCILFGEHAVVRGEPELLLAIDLPLQLGITPSPDYRLNGSTEAASAHPYLKAARERLWDDAYGAFNVEVVSRIPRAAGLGSSAAFTSALAAGLSAVRGGVERSLLAEHSFAIERAAQGVGSPGDTSAVVGGGYVAVNAGSGALLWELSDGSNRWTARRVTDPGWVWLVAYSGVPRSTADAVRAVERRLSEPDGSRLLEQFREVATLGVEAVAREDRAAIGPLLDRNHALLREVGVSHPRLEALLDAVRPVSEGAKLTGAGAGGSIVALVRSGREAEATRRVQRAGGAAYVVRADPAGTDLVVPKGAPSAGLRSAPPPPP